MRMFYTPPAAPPASAEESTPATPLESDAIDRVRGECFALGADDAAREPMGWIRWVDARSVLAGLPALDPWWVEAFAAFLASGKPIHAGAVSVRGAKSTSVCRALTALAILQPRTLPPGEVGVVPILSIDRTEASGRAGTIVKVLRAMGYRGEHDDAEPLPGGLAGTFSEGQLPSGARVVRTTDAQGHAIEFRCYAARKSAAVGYTMIAGFADEVDKWPAEDAANPAADVLALLRQRGITQPDARLFVFSAAYADSEGGEHASLIAAGDTDAIHVATLGERGAEIDTLARRALAEQIGSSSPRLLRASDPACRFIPSWVSSPMAPIDRVYAAAGDVDKMLDGVDGPDSRGEGDNGPGIGGVPFGGGYGRPGGGGREGGGGDGRGGRY